MKTPTKITAQSRIRLLNASLEKAERIAYQLSEVNSEEWGTSLGVHGGKAAIGLHGPDCEVFSSTSINDLVDDFLDTDPDTLVAESTVLINAFARAIGRIRSGARLAQLEIDKNPERYKRQ